jgi:hypothetical protein
MCHSARELANRVQLLRLEQLRERMLPLTGALLDPLLKLLIQSVQLRCRGL